MAWEGQELRSNECSKCGRKENEKIFGVGFPGWNRISEIIDKKIIKNKIIIDGKSQEVSQEIQVNPILCPDCLQKISDWLNNKEEKI
jgi:hypothetical protein